MRHVVFLADLPQAGVEVLQLALLVLALLMVGARLRVLALRRRHGWPPPGRRTARVAAHGREEDFVEPAPSRRRDAAPARDEWAFPDPSEPAPTGLLPSTASARRRARALAMSGDRN